MGAHECRSLKGNGVGGLEDHLPRFTAFLSSPVLWYTDSSDWIRFYKWKSTVLQPPKGCLTFFAIKTKWVPVRYVMPILSTGFGKSMIFTMYALANT